MMQNKKSNLVERHLYEYTLNAVCCPLRVIESGATTDQLAAHVAKLFNVNPEEHEQKYMRALKIQPCPVVLFVDVKKARNLPGEDQNGLSDPYCKVSVVYTPGNPDDINGLASNLRSISPPSTPNLNQHVSLFSCASAPPSKIKTKTKSRLAFFGRRSSRSSIRRRSSLGSTANGKVISTVTYRTGVRPKTIDPEWNEHYEFEIINVYEQHFHISVYDSDRGELPQMKTVVKEKRGLAGKIRGMRTLFSTGHIEDDFLGQLTLDIKALATFEGEKWFPLVGLNQNRVNNNKQRGEILLGLKIHFKLQDKLIRLTDTLYPYSSTTSKDEKSSKQRQRSSTDNVWQFRRRQSMGSSNVQTNSSIILRSSIFRKNFRPASVQTRDYSKTSIFEDNTQTHSNLVDQCLTPATDSDLPLLIEEYHQLFRIVMLHELEDAREMNKDPENGLVISWAGSLNELSYSILMQFRVLYNIPVLSEAFMQLLVIMELRCSEDYAKFISQGVIEAYLKLFMDKVHKRTDAQDLDFTDYEKTVFKEILHLFIGHYKQRVHNDAPWFLPLKENLPNLQSIFETICTLLKLKICSNETTIKNHLEETIKFRLQTDINDSFTVHQFVFNDKHDIQTNIVRDFVDYVKKISDSMSVISEYNKIFALFSINYIKICFFESNSAGDRLSELIKCLLINMTDHFQIYAKPIVTATSSIFDPNLIQSSSSLFYLYLYLQMIITSLRTSLEARDWQINAFKLKLVDYRQWFSPIMKYLLEGFVAQIRQAMERAVEDDSELIPDDDRILYSNSAIAATSLCLKLCDEWERIDYPDINVRYTAIIKLTNTICEQCQHYARRTERKLSEHGYFTDLNRTRSFNVTKKLCMLVNDIEYVKRNVLSSLPRLLNFSTVIEKMIENYESKDFEQTRITLERLISSAEQEMTDVIKLIFEHVAKLVHKSLTTKITIYYRDEQQAKPDCVQDVTKYIDQILQDLFKGLEPVHYFRVACAIRIKVLQCLRELLLPQEPPEFYTRVLQSFNQLAAYFDAVCREDPHLPGPPCDEIATFRKTLQQFALTTEQLQLWYFRDLCHAHSPHEHRTAFGEITFRAAHENVNGLVSIEVEILSCQDLASMDVMTGSSDPYVVLELLPFTLYHKPLKEYKTVTQNRTLNPQYHDLFSWHRLPLNVLQEKGAVLRISVWDADYLKDDFIGEVFVPLTSLESLSNRASLRDIPVTQAPLRRPHKNFQPRAFEFIRNRASFDEHAAVFLKQRTAIMQSGNASDGTSIKSDDEKSAGGNRRQEYQQKKNFKPPLHESMQSISTKTGYRLWNLLQWKGDSASSSLENLQETPLVGS